MPARRFLPIALPAAGRLPPLTLLLLAGLALSLAACTTPRELALPRPRPGPAVAPLPVASHLASPEEKAFWSALAETRVIYVAETHDRESDHLYQLELMRGLRSRGVTYSIGWEMFETPQQEFLTAWSRGSLSTEALLEKTDWQRRWGNQSPVYERILRWSRGENIASVALNAPATLSGKLARGESLAPEERALIPTGYRPIPGGFEHFGEQMGQNPHVGAGAGEGLKRYYAAQLLWDQTMAESIVAYLRAHPDGKLVVLLGRGHVEGGFGVPAYVRQKTDARQRILFPGETPGGPDEETRPARVAWLHAPEALPAAARKTVMTR